MWPQIVRLGSDGEPQWTAHTVNVYERHLNYIYPGESVEQWVQFYSAPHLPWPGRGLAEGKYRVEFTMLYRYYQHFNWGINIWHGKDFAKVVVPITVAKTAGQTPVDTSVQITDTWRDARLYRRIRAVHDRLQDLPACFGRRGAGRYGVRAGLRPGPRRSP